MFKTLKNLYANVFYKRNGGRENADSIEPIQFDCWVILPNRAMLKN
jgi:hypothetical protein